MNIKKYIGLIPCIASLAFTLIATGCDNIDSDDRYLKEPKPELPGEPRTLLIQEFTGHDCRNCPAGAAALSSIAASYPGRVITVGMHPEGGGPNTAPIGTQDFRCEEAQVMYLYYKPSGFPCAVFGGVEMSSQTSEWLTRAIPFMSLEAPLEINAYPQYDKSSRELKLHYTSEIRQTVNAELNVMAWVVENGIVGIQNDKGSYILNYVHNHVLRASLNGDWGQPLGIQKDGKSPLTQYSPLTNFEGDASMTLNENWVAENCMVVVWVFDTATKEVLQAIEVPVVSDAD